ncbi:hypothetical protein Scep_011530 [Stephania cephalantha]|uniref:Glutamate receptor n=1 Tax=Stephania cephalantha TaxID=152367 RepID=A0AAP0JFI0_9MAGN
MEIALKEFNNSSKHSLKLFARDSGGNPLRASAIAEDLIRHHKAHAIIGMQSWQEAALAAEVANRAKVPILSFSAPAVTPPLTSSRWPYMLRMTKDDSLQIQCAADIVGFYGWRRVIVIFETDVYGGYSGILALLSGALKNVSSEIEYLLAFPHFSSMSDPKTVIHDELNKLLSHQSRVFVVVQSSVELASHLFMEANKIGLMGKDSVWITTDSVANFVDSMNSSDLLSMRGVLGIKTYFMETSASFQNFSAKFQNNFRSRYPKERKLEPGIHALRAYDTVAVLAKTMKRLPINSTTETLLETVASSRFNGLSGKIQFKDGELSSSPIYQIINIVQKSYMELGFWSLDFGFSQRIESNEHMGRNVEGIKEVLDGRIYWPGGLLKRRPTGWVMPTIENPLKIGIPGRTAFEMFVKVEKGKKPTGFCIDVFDKAMDLLGYDLQYDFEAFDGSYDDLVDRVYRKEYDAVVGDMTVLANRSNYVDFAMPYVESGLLMIVPVKPEDAYKALLFTKPFTREMWLATGAIFAYTMFVVWFLEHRSNPEFRGPWRNQLGTALWFTFSSLFFAHRERVGSNFSRIVILVWLFVVFVVTSSYTASLTSMLTVQRLEPTITDIESLKRSNSKVGCDGDSFVLKYLENVLRFDKKNIIHVKNEYDYPNQFKSGNISAAFLELPYGKIFLSTYSKDYTAVGQTQRFGGLSFVFPKGSPMAKDFSEAFLKLSEDGTIIQLEHKWFERTSQGFSNPDTAMNNQSLDVDSFWGLFLLTGATSTIIFLLYLIHLVGRYRRQESHDVNITSRDDSFWNRTRRLAVYFHKGQLQHPERTPTSPGSDQYGTSMFTQPVINMEPLRGSPRRLFSLASFPGRDRRVHALTSQHV